MLTMQMRHQCHACKPLINIQHDRDESGGKTGRPNRQPGSYNLNCLSTLSILKN
jgi:hypothetical protein